MLQLILGGARSGKSRLAEKLASDSGLSVTYIATSRPLDGEMNQRIALHRGRRPGHWGLIEEPLELARVLGENAAADHCLLVDCLTLWLTNLLMLEDADRMAFERDQLLQTLASLPGEIIFVSNETGLGVVPLGELTRRYVDEAGWLHQALAERCQRPCKAIDASAYEQALARQQQLTKPAGSLGQLEALAVQLAGLQGQVKPSVDRLWIAIFAGDHGVVAEGVSAFPQEVTGQMLHNFVTGGAAISVLARRLDAQLEVVDLGTVTPSLDLPGVRHLNIGAGTANFVDGPAMTQAQGQLALQAGRDSVSRALDSGAQLFIGGEMGIGNTTAASALACALLDCPVSDLTGPGTGLNAAGVSHKIAVIERALALHAAQRGDALQTLFNLGGFEMAALVGAYLACAQEGIAVLVDGFICSVAALVAVRLNPACRQWLVFGHRGAEPGHRHVLHSLDARPLLELGLRLGEGSGAALAVPLLRLACALHGQMATFAEAAVADRPA
ncbi:hypothetical protein PYW08_016931 [Mythimna loreyi]|nr:hypothetical protein PYW08_016931 [Mythimna loreyi]